MWGFLLVPPVLSHTQGSLLLALWQPRELLGHLHVSQPSNKGAPWCGASSWWCLCSVGPWSPCYWPAAQGELPQLVALLCLGCIQVIRLTVV